MTMADEYRARVEREGWRPRNVGLELTLACNLRCLHCGSEAGAARSEELTQGEWITVVDDLVGLGAEIISLTGGEPTLYRGWDRIARAVSDRGLLVNMVTNGAFRDRQAAREVASRAADCGMANVGVSIDGPREVHEAIRGRGSFDKSMVAVEELLARGVKVAVMTTVNRLNFPHLEAMYGLVLAAGPSQWRLHLAKPMGSFMGRPEMMLRPRQLLELVPLLARLKRERRVGLQIGDSIGYYGPHDRTLRGWGWRGRRECWQGCQAGMEGIAVEADGSVKGCLSLQVRVDGRDPFLEGNVRQTPLPDLWHQPGRFAYTRDFDMEDLTGLCRRCRHRKLCRGGARCMAFSVTGRLGEDPYCYYRLSRLEESRRSRAAQGVAAAAAAVMLSLGSGCGAPPPDGTSPPAMDGGLDVWLDQEHDMAIVDIKMPMDLAEEGPEDGEPDVIEDQISYGGDYLAALDVEEPEDLEPEDLVEDVAEDLSEAGRADGEPDAIEDQISYGGDYVPSLDLEEPEDLEPEDLAGDGAEAGLVDGEPDAYKDRASHMGDYVAVPDLEEPEDLVEEE